jgi:pimeloyl-ACP methyl ester carboxylesterase
VKTRWKVLIGLVVVLAALLVLNAVALNNQTKAAETTIEGGEIVSLPGGDVQVFEDGVEDARAAKARPPIVLVHCYSCSLHWWDRMAPILARDHRVIRVDLLGHGGSEKPKSGYEIPQQAALVAGALNEFEVEGAVVVGHSMGASVATALAEESSELVDRVVIVDEAPDTGYGGLGLLARLSYVPVLGQALNRLSDAPGGDSAVKAGYEEAFAPGFDIESGFPNPDQVVDDFDTMTYTAFDETHDANNDFLDEQPLTERLTAAAVPVMAIFGSEDQVYDDPAEALAAYEDVPGAQTAEIEGAGHSPNVEEPEETAALIREFAANASDADIGPPPEGGKKGKRGEPRGPSLVVQRALEDPEGSTLWIGEDGDPALGRLEPRELGAAELLGLLGRRVAVGDDEVGQPVRRLALLRVHHAAVAPLADVDDDVPGAVAGRHLLGAPAEERGVELERGVDVRGVQLVPGQAAGLVDPLRADVVAGLPPGQEGARRIGDHGHPAGGHDVEGLHRDVPADLAGLRGEVVGALDGDVVVPVRRRGVALTPRRDRGDAVAFDLARDVHAATRLLGDRVVLEPPAQQLSVERLGSVGVRGRQIDPAERPRRVLATPSHLLLLRSAWLDPS